MGDLREIEPCNEQACPGRHNTNTKYTENYSILISFLQIHAKIMPIHATMKAFRA